MVTTTQANVIRGLKARIASASTPGKKAAATRKLNDYARAVGLTAEQVAAIG